MIPRSGVVVSLEGCVHARIDTDLKEKERKNGLEIDCEKGVSLSLSAAWIKGTLERSRERPAVI